MTVPRTTVGVVGCGAVTRRMYARVLPGLPGVQTTHVCDLDAAAAGRAAAVLGARVAQFDQLLESVDTVVVATPPGTHFELVRGALERGRNVVCEKPFVVRRSDAETLVRLAASEHVRLSVGHFRRVFPAVIAARDLIATGILGAVREIDIREGGRFAWETVSGYVSRDLFGGVLFDTGSHALDTALFVAGWDLPDLVVDVQVVQRDRTEPSHEVRAEFRMRRDGASPIAVRLALSRYQSLANRVRVTLEGGTLDVSAVPRSTWRLTGGGGTCVLSAGGRAPDHEACFAEQLRRILSTDGDDTFAGHRFVGLTTILETLTTRGT